MRIIHVITAFGIGGAEKLLVNIINKQVEDHEVHLVYLKNINDLLPFVDKRVNVKHIPLSFTTLLKLRKYYKKIKPNIVHTHLSHADILGISATIALKVKVFCTMHNIYFKKNKTDDFLFFVYKLIFKIRKVRVISISKSVEKHVMQRLKQPQKRSFLLYNAIPPQENEIARIAKKTGNDVNILFIGRLVKQKSVETLLRAVENLKDDTVKLTIVGEGELRSELEDLAAQLEIKNQVIFTGEQKEVDTYFNNTDIFVLPSIWEGFGIVILEAFRAKKAVIATNIEGPSELIEDGENGLLFTPKDYKGLSFILKTVVKNKELRNHLAEEGYKTFSEKYHIETYTKELQKLYQDATND